MQIIDYYIGNKLEHGETSPMEGVVKFKNGQVSPAVFRKIDDERMRIYKTLHNYKWPFTPQIYGFLLDNDGSKMVIMEFVRGKTFEDYFRNKKLAPQTFLSVSYKLFHSLLQMHTMGIVHGDIKPKNIIVKPNGEIVLMDFEFSKMPVGDVLVPSVGFTPEYTSKEQLEGKVGFRTDWRSLAITLLKAFIGRHPFQHLINGVRNDYRKISQIVASHEVAFEYKPYYRDVWELLTILSKMTYVEYYSRPDYMTIANFLFARNKKR